MTLHPVIVRELRVEARNPLNYWMRAMTVLAAGAVLAGVTFFPGRRPQMVGGNLFTWLHGLVYLGICILVPVMTADCLGREKREGTLGLMFLTPLRAIGIVLSKSAVHGLRATSLVLVVIPVMAVVFLLGGVSWQQMALALLMDLSALALALGAGVLASASGQSWERTVVFGWVTGWALVLAFFLELLWFFLLLEGRIGDFPILIWIAQSAYLVANIGTIDLPLNFWRSLLNSGLLCTLTAWLAAWWLMRLAAARVSRSWQDNPPSEKAIRRREALCKVRFGLGMFKQRMGRALDANPIGWLHEFSWQARLAKWLVLSACILAEGWLMTGNVNDFEEGQMTLLGLLLAGVAFSATASFLRERRSGAMELILVTPLPVTQILIGRMKGIWTQFFPALLALAVCAGFGGNRPGTEYWLLMLHGAVAFWVLPLAGMYFSLRQKSFVAAWLMGVGAMLGGPVTIAGLVAFAVGWVNYLAKGSGGGFDEFNRLMGQSVLIDALFFSILFVAQAAGAHLFFHLLKRRLDERDFVANFS